MLRCPQGKLTLKTTEMETIYDLGTKMIDALTKEKVCHPRARFATRRALFAAMDNTGTEKDSEALSERNDKHLAPKVS